MRLSLVPLRSRVRTLPRLRRGTIPRSGGFTSGTLGRQPKGKRRGALSLKFLLEAAPPKPAERAETDHCDPDGGAVPHGGTVPPGGPHNLGQVAKGGVAAGVR